MSIPLSTIESTKTVTKPNLCLGTRFFGHRSETWLYRQAIGMTQLDVKVISWTYENQADFPISKDRISIMPFDPFPDDGKQRWLRRIRNLQSGNFYGSTGAELRTLLKLAAQTRTDAILCHFGPIALRLSPVAQKSKVPLTAHFHGIDLTANLRNRWYFRSLKKTLPTFAAAVVVADYQKEILLGLGYDESKIHVIPCGVPVPSRQAAAPGDSQTCEFLMVGRLVEKKAPLTTINAFAITKQSSPQVRLKIVGDGPLVSDCQALVEKLGISESVDFLGAVGPDTVMDCMEKASVFVQHSVTASTGDKEGWPVSIAEAMALGLPVVSTRHAGIVNQVVEGETGYLVEEGDTEGMASAMLRLAQDPNLRTRYGAASYKRAKEHFDNKLTLSKLESVILGTIETNRSR